MVFPTDPAQVYRDFVTDGVPASGANSPKKAEIRRMIAERDAALNAGLSNGGLIYVTKANLDADIAHGVNASAWVIGDATVANNGIYRKTGASGSGSWARVGDLPYSFIRAADAGAGSANAIVATSSIPMPTADGAALVTLNIFEANTSSPVTVSFNGGSPLTIKTSSGSDIAAGGLVAGMIVAGYVSGSTFRLLSEQAGAAVVAAAEAAAARSESAALSVTSFIRTAPVAPESSTLWNPEDTAAAIADAAAFAVSEGRPLMLASGGVYAFSRLAIPAGAIITGRDAVLRYLGNVANKDIAPLTLGNGVQIDELNFSSPGTEVNLYDIELGRDVNIGHLVAIADVQKNNSLIHAIGSNLRIDVLRTKKYDRPLFLDGDAGAASGTHIGFVDIESFVTGLRIYAHTGFVIGGHYMRGRSPNVPALINPGHNGILFGGASHGFIGDGIVNDAGEHAYRIGGHATARTKFLKFGNLSTARSRGSAFKINPYGKNAIAPGNDYADDIEVASITGVDCGDGQLGELGKTPDFIRITSGRRVRIGWGECHNQAQPYSCLNGITLNDCASIYTGPLTVANAAGSMFYINETQDVEVGDEGGVNHVYIESLRGTCLGNSALSFSTKQPISNILVDDVSVSGYAVRLLAFDAALNATGLVRVSGRSTGTVRPAISGVPTSDNVVLDWSHNGNRYVGPARFYRVDATGAMQIVGDSASLSAGPRGMFLNSQNLVAVLNSYTEGVEFSRNGTSRLGAAIAGKHTSATLAQLGLAFLIKANTVSGSDDLVEAMILDHLGSVQLPVSGSGIVFASPNGSIKKKLTIDNTGTAVWTTV